jgi:hypothetical protein
MFDAGRPSNKNSAAQANAAEEINDEVHSTFYSWMRPA